MPYVTSAERFGIEKGLRQGIEQGLQQGIEKGHRQGIEHGQVIACRENILELLKVRLGTVTKDLRARSKAETNLQRLRRLLRAAATCTRAEDLRLS